MQVNIFSDPHLGVSRKAHTTRESSRRLNQAIYERAMEARRGHRMSIIPGDLFDKTNNPESVVIQGLQVAEGAIVLGGNHDETNRDGTKSSLDVVEGSGVAQVIRQQSLSKPFYARLGPLVFVPHHATQELFVAALQEAMLAVDEHEGDHYLFVHCNRWSVPGERADSTLVIEQEMEQALLRTFTRIFYGHIHQPSMDMGDRVVVLGNVHPTSFSDISNKYRYELDTDTDTLTRHLLWEEDQSVTLPMGEDVQDTGAEFIEIVGQGTRKEVSDYVQAVWEANPRALAVRPNVTLLSTEGRALQSVDLSDLGSQIRRDLQGTALLALYRELEASL